MKKANLILSLFLLCTSALAGVALSKCSTTVSAISAPPIDKYIRRLAKTYEGDKTEDEVENKVLREHGNKLSKENKCLIFDVSTDKTFIASSPLGWMICDFGQKPLKGLIPEFFKYRFKGKQTKKSRNKILQRLKFILSSEMAKAVMVIKRLENNNYKLMIKIRNDQFKYFKKLQKDFNVFYKKDAINQKRQEDLENHFRAQHLYDNYWKPCSELLLKKNIACS